MNSEYIIPSVYQKVYETFNDIDIEYNPETIDNDIINISKDIESLIKRIEQNSELYHEGELEFNSITDDILEYLEKRRQLEYLSIINKVKSNLPINEE
jgi:hypothetical protein